jgi:hypothetical protein
MNLPLNILAICVVEVILMGFIESCPEDSQKYKLVMESEGVCIYEYWYNYHKTTPARGLKVTYKLEGSLRVVLNSLQDERLVKQWNKNVSTSIISLQNDEKWIGYMHYQMPWPVQDQDCVLLYNVNEFKSNRLEVEFITTTHEGFPPTKSTERMNFVKGKWIFNVVDNGIELEYYVTTVPNKNLPRWLTDPIVRHNLLSTIHSFSDFVAIKSRTNSFRK